MLSLKGLSTETLQAQLEKPFPGEAAALRPLTKVETPGHWHSSIKFNTSMATGERRGKCREGKGREERIGKEGKMWNKEEMIEEEKSGEILINL